MSITLDLPQELESELAAEAMQLGLSLTEYALHLLVTRTCADHMPTTPIEALVKALVQAIETAENHLNGLGFDPVRLVAARGFDRIQALRDAVDALYTSDEAKRRFEIMARQVFIRFKALLMEPSAFAYAYRHDNIEAIYKKLEEKRATAGVTEVLKGTKLSTRPYAPRISARITPRDFPWT